MRRAAPIHALPLVNANAHYASSTCPCRPEPRLRDFATGADVWVHWADPDGRAAIDRRPAPVPSVRGPDLRGERNRRLLTQAEVLADPSDD
jgi:hypothetical protein